MVGLESFLCFPMTLGGSFGVQPFVFLGRIWNKKIGRHLLRINQDKMDRQLHRAFVIVCLSCEFLCEKYVQSLSLPMVVPTHPVKNMGVSLNGGTPKSSILIGFSIINHSILGYIPLCSETPIYKRCFSWIGGRIARGQLTNKTNHHLGASVPFFLAVLGDLLWIIPYGKIAMKKPPFRINANLSI